jgi:AraC family transcriptional regulator
MSNPFYPEGLTGFDTFENYNSKIEIRSIPDYIVIFERMIGNYYELKEKWFAFLDQYRDYRKADTLLLERFYDDPS